MKDYIVSPDAEVDLEEILDLVRAASPRAARDLLADLEHTFALLSDHPEAGRVRDAFRAGLRSFPIGAHHAFYRRVRRGVEIVRVVHGRRDLERIARHWATSSLCESVLRVPELRQRAIAGANCTRTVALATP